MAGLDTPAHSIGALLKMMYEASAPEMGHGPYMIFTMQAWMPCRGGRLLTLRRQLPKFLGAHTLTPLAELITPRDSIHAMISDAFSSTYTTPSPILVDYDDLPPLTSADAFPVEDGILLLHSPLP